LLFEGLLDGALSGRTHSGLTAHLERCSDCTGLLEELRIVDALLLRVPVAELPDDFTQRTMAQVSACAPPRPASIPVVELLTAYLSAAWLMVAFALVFDGAQARAVLAAAFGLWSREVAALGSLGHGLFHSFEASLSGLTAVSVGTLALDVVAGLALIAVYRALRSEVVR
jgi:anti-sigma factor RsiW